MAGKSPLRATGSERLALEALAGSGGRGEADRARAILLTLVGWTSKRISQAFGVREDTVRLWRGDFMRGGVDALRARVAAGPAPVKAEAALRVVAPLLSASVADRTNWTLARLAGEVAKNEGVTISLSQLSKVLRKKGGIATGGHDTH